jgi:hypothetical protein
MKTQIKILLLVLAAASLLVYAADVDPVRLVLRITRPSPDCSIITTNSSIRLGGYVRPAGNIDVVKFVASTGHYGPCRLISNALWHSPTIPLAPGYRNFITVIGIDTNTHRAAMDFVHVMRITPGVISNRPPRIISHPHRLWGTNRVYRYVLKAVDPDNDRLRLKLRKRGPVETTVHRIKNGKWLISAIMTGEARRVRFKAYVYDGFNRPARQGWTVYLPPDRTEEPAPIPDIDPDN